MKRLIQLLVCCFSACLACAQGTLQVLPSGYANVEGNSASGDLFRTTSSKFQQVYSASAFSFLSGVTGRIDGLSFRFDGPTAQNFANVWSSVSVTLSTGSREPDSLSAMYEANAGTDPLEVYGGSLTIVSTFSPGVRSFDVQIPFTTPFFYDPSRGNLTLTILTSPGPTNLFLDAQSSVGDSVGRVYGGISLTGTPDTLGLVTRFSITPIPEPSAVVLGVTSALFFWGLRGRIVIQKERQKG
jgi:hypothetical protein